MNVPVNMPLCYMRLCHAVMLHAVMLHAVMLRLNMFWILNCILKSKQTGDDDMTHIIQYNIYTNTYFLKHSLISNTDFVAMQFQVISC